MVAVDVFVEYSDYGRDFLHLAKGNNIVKPGYHDA